MSIKILIIIYIVAGWLLCSSGSPASATVYRWTDAQGQTHFSDSATGSQTSQAIELPPAAAGAAAGLRPGERSTLKAIKQRQQVRHRQAEALRRAQRHQRNTQRATCREHREQLRRGRRHVDSKTILKYLRKYCW